MCEEDRKQLGASLVMGIIFGLLAYFGAMPENSLTRCDNFNA